MWAKLKYLIIMKKTLIIFSLLFGILSLKAQVIYNNNARVIVTSNTSFIFHSLNNEGASANFYFDAHLHVPGNWINNASANFEQGPNGSVELNGSSQQIVQSANKYFGKLTINNSSNH